LVCKFSRGDAGKRDEDATGSWDIRAVDRHLVLTGGCMTDELDVPANLSCRLFILNPVHTTISSSSSSNERSSTSIMSGGGLGCIRNNGEQIR
jgi:hypothetical protein